MASLGLLVCLAAMCGLSLEDQTATKCRESVPESDAAAMTFQLQDNPDTITLLYLRSTKNDVNDLLQCEPSRDTARGWNCTSKLGFSSTGVQEGAKLTVTVQGVRKNMQDTYVLKGFKAEGPTTIVTCELIVTDAVTSSPATTTTMTEESTGANVASIAAPVIIVCIIVLIAVVLLVVFRKRLLEWWQGRNSPPKAPEDVEENDEPEKEPFVRVVPANPDPAPVGPPPPPEPPAQPPPPAEIEGENGDIEPEDITREVAEERLKSSSMEDGAFIIRRSQGKARAITLAVRRSSTQVTHHLIEEKDNRYKLTINHNGDNSVMTYGTLKELKKGLSNEKGLFDLERFKDASIPAHTPFSP